MVEDTGFDPFDGDEDVILTDLAVDRSSRIYLSENAEFSGVPNRVAIMGWDNDQLNLIDVQENLIPFKCFPHPSQAMLLFLVVMEMRFIISAVKSSTRFLCRDTLHNFLHPLYKSQMVL